MHRRIVVTGVAGAVGHALAVRLAAVGVEVIGIDLADEALGCGLFIGGVDLTCAESVGNAIDRIEGAIDGLANIAGGFRWESVEDGDPRTWERLFSVNVLTALHVTRAVLPRMQSGAAIVNVGAAATLQAGAGMGAYTASKSAVARLTEATAEETKPRGIRVNAVLPSIVDTPANRREMGTADAAKWVGSAELAEVIAFLLSPTASGINGASLPVRGRV